MAWCERCTTTTTTALLGDILKLNSGIDFRRVRLGSPTSICAGAAADIGNNFESETQLSARKLASGAQFLICQPSFDAERALRFRQKLADTVGDSPLPPIFAGVQIPIAGRSGLRKRTRRDPPRPGSGAPGPRHRQGGGEGALGRRSQDVLCCAADIQVGQAGITTRPTS